MCYFLERHIKGASYFVKSKAKHLRERRKRATESMATGFITDNKQWEPERSELQVSTGHMAGGQARF